MKQKLERLKQYEEKWVSDSGFCFPGVKAFFRGKDLHRDLKHLTWFELNLFGITGRFFSAEQIRVLNAMWCFTSYPDPRIWNNRISAICGTVKSTNYLAIAAAVAASDAKIFGGTPNIESMKLLLHVSERLKNESLRDIVQDFLLNNIKLYGFGRPILGGDERIQPLKEFVIGQGLHHGAYFNLCFRLEEEIQLNKKNRRMNYAILCAAICADFGFSISEFSNFGLLSFVAGNFPVYLSTLQKPVNSFLPTRPSCIDYRGPALRDWT